MDIDGVHIPPLPIGAEIVPHLGMVELEASEKTTHAEWINRHHCPGLPTWRSLLLWPLWTIERYCTFCEKPWPCAASDWARRALRKTT